MNFIELFNMVSQVSRPAHAAESPATSMDQKLAEINIDSLDGLIIGMYFCELYGIPDDDETKSVESHDDLDDHGVMCHYSRTTGGWEPTEPYCVECGYGEDSCVCDEEVRNIWDELNRQCELAEKAKQEQQKKKQQQKKK
jgi:hypothetical protein